MKFPETSAQFRRFSWIITTAFWAFSLACLGFAFTVSPGAINAAIGAGIVAVLLTVLSALNKDRTP